MVQPIALKSISTREAVADAVYRALYGLDANDHALWASGWAKDDDITFVLRETMVGLKAIDEGVFNRAGPLETQHLLSNIRIDLNEEAKTARLFAYAQNQHFCVGEGLDFDAKGLLSGSKYEIDLKEDAADGLWKVKVWKIQVIWLEGDRSVLGM